MEQSWKQSAYYLNLSEPQLGGRAWTYVQKRLVLNPLSYEFKGPEMKSWRKIKNFRQKTDLFIFTT